MEKVSLQNLGEFARRVLDHPCFAKATQGDKATIIALSGELGAGKTTFTQQLAKELGVTEVVQSPTYVLMKNYDISKNTLIPFSKLIHIDAYRLTGPEEFATLWPGEFLHDKSALVVVEWPERLGGALPAPDLTIRFSSDDAGEGERYIEVV